nr:MAG: major capsid protein [Microvirus sp.]
MKIGNQSHFANVPSADIQRSSFDRSNGLKTTFDSGYLVPVFCDEVLPGDTHELSMAAFCRLATPIKPFFDNLYLESFFFFVPNRLIWANWEKFCGEQVNPGDSTDYLMPVISDFAPASQTIFDYFGLPAGQALTVSGCISLPFRAYNLIYNEWFRDENLQNSVATPVTDGPDSSSDFALLRRGKRKDYFTSALPWPQKGPAVTLPLGTVAYGTQIERFNGGTWNTPSLIEIRGSGDPQGAGDLRIASGGFASPQNGRVIVDLATATAATINSLREAFQLQRLFERDARGGTRYTEILLSHFRVKSPDARLQRPEYLGGGVSMVNVNPIAQTSSATAQPTPQGNLAAMGTVSVRSHSFRQSFVEHGYVIGLVSVRQDYTYQRRLDRMWSRRTRFDHYWPALAHLGEQAVLNKEIYYDPADSLNDSVFGYQERFAEYRYKPSMITGLMRSGVSGSLDVWHLAQNFASRPTLSSTFIVENPPIDRVIAVPSEPDFLGDFHFKLKSTRPMPVYSVPGLIDHF